MTVYVGALNNRHQAAASVKLGHHTSVFKLNLFLMLAAMIVIMVYVFTSNLMVARRYALNLRKSELNQLNARLAAENQYGGRGEDLRALLSFAQNYGLVEAKDIDSILEKDGFAILP
ncbi:MAG: hypothetical protein HYT65_01155 [Candidatus Yanofskybacteria bacterium]|nr:hypothetical protein [Candidatus Yanofskybacteria bacterium]